MIHFSDIFLKIDQKKLELKCVYVQNRQFEWFFKTAF